MSTGRKGTYRTRYGTIEFTHTKRRLEEVLKSMRAAPGRPLRVATLEAARRDLRRAGRNLHLMNEGDSASGRHGL